MYDVIISYISDNFKGSVVKMLQEGKILLNKKIKGKKKNKKTRRHKVSKKFKLQGRIKWKFSVEKKCENSMVSIAEWRCQRKESMN